jgi:DNA-directed RNA polymerase subunit RPC12/RpoP
MGTYDNLPPGVSVSDLPGWHDITAEVEITCPNCGHAYEEEHEIDGRDGYTTDVETECPKCGHKWEHAVSVSIDY